MTKPIRPHILVLAAGVTIALGAAGCAATPRQALVLQLSRCPIGATQTCAERLGYRPQMRNGSATDIYCRKQQPVVKGEALPQCFDMQKETRYVLARVRLQGTAPTPAYNVHSYTSSGGVAPP